MKIARVTISDRATAGIYEDRGGPEIERVCRDLFEEPLEFVVRLLADERALIGSELIRLSDRELCPLILTTGGTGPAPRDVTPEATRDILEKELIGFGEAMRWQSFAKVPTAILSRATAGVRGRSLIVNLPGNPKAISECLPMLARAIAEGLSHVADFRPRLRAVS